MQHIIQNISKTLVPLLLLLALTAGCASLNPFSNKGPKPCEYRDVFTIAKVVSSSANEVEFEVTGYRRVTLARTDLIPEYPYNVGDEHNARQRFLTDGDKKNCEKYILQVLRKR